VSATDEVRALTLRFYEMFSSGDARAANELISAEGGTLVIGTDPSEWWSDRGEIVNTLSAQAKEISESGIRIEPGEIVARAEDGIAWVADRPKFVMPDGSAVEARVTGVFRREGGSWKIAQWHASLGVQNEEAIGQDLTT
jgi:ketosteroid isomerase-like protein